MLLNSASGLGFSILATTVRVASAMDEIPERAVDTELGAVVLVVIVLASPDGRGSARYSAGMGTQLLECWKVPRRRSDTSVR